MMADLQVHRCSLCRGELQVKVVDTSAGAMSIAQCMNCDRRRCKSGHMIEDPHARKCPECGEFL